MLVHLVAAEQFRSQRRLVAGVIGCRAISTEAGRQVEQVPETGLAAHLQFYGLLVSLKRSLNETAEKLSLIARYCRLCGYIPPAGLDSLFRLEAISKPPPYFSPAIRGETETGKGSVDLFPVQRAHAIRVRHGREPGGE
jgi:hypothetical protein